MIRLPSAGQWLRMTKSHRCPICEKPDWCVALADTDVVLCMRVESTSPVRSGGWVHRVGDGPRAWDGLPPPQPPRRLPTRDFEGLARQWARDAERNPEAFEKFGADLGIAASALTCFGVGWTGEAWSFPMHDADRRIIGIRLRRQYQDGTSKKYCVRGSRNGLFLPAHLQEGGPLSFAEGATDACALLQLGLPSIGRPDCQGASQEAIPFAKGRDVIVVADSDVAGRRGANLFASRLLLHARSVRVMEPPDGFKDAREWVSLGGATMDTVIQRAFQCPVRQLRFGGDA